MGRERSANHGWQSFHRSERNRSAQIAKTYGAGIHRRSRREHGFGTAQVVRPSAPRCQSPAWPAPGPRRCTRTILASPCAAEAIARAMWRRPCPGFPSSTSRTWPESAPKPLRKLVIGAIRHAETPTPIQPASEGQFEKFRADANATQPDTASARNPNKTHRGPNRSTALPNGSCIAANPRK